MCLDSVLIYKKDDKGGVVVCSLAGPCFPPVFLSGWVDMKKERCGLNFLQKQIWNLFRICCLKETQPKTATSHEKDNFLLHVIKFKSEARCTLNIFFLPHFNFKLQSTIKKNEVQKRSSLDLIWS